MSRNWKTVYSSAHRKVLVRPRSRPPGPPRTVVNSKLLLRERIYGKSIFEMVLDVIGALLVMVLVLLFFIYLFEACWPLFVLSIILFGTCTSSKKSRPK